MARCNMPVCLFAQERALLGLAQRRMGHRTRREEGRRKEEGRSSPEARVSISFRDGGPMMSLSPPARHENSKMPPPRINQRDHPCALIFFMNFFSSFCAPPSPSLFVVVVIVSLSGASVFDHFTFFPPSSVLLFFSSRDLLLVEEPLSRRCGVVCLLLYSSMPRQFAQMSQCASVQVASLSWSWSGGSSGDMKGVSN